MKPRIGVYICHCGLNIAGSVDVKLVVEYASRLPNVVLAKDYTYVCSDPGQLMIQEDIKRENLNKVIVAACSPRMHEQTFQKTLSMAGLNPYLLEVANIREHCSWPHEKEPENATEKAKGLVRMAVARASLLEPLEPVVVPIEKAALVIGGGIAGITASLKLADSGFKVYLVERQPSIGGRMAQLDKTFPTLDCSACILTPLMVDVSRHPNIVLLTYSEVEEVSGYVGNFKVKIKGKPRYVDTEKCTGCGTCIQKCPVKVPNEFDVRLSERKAIYLPFPQAIPLKCTIDKEYCLYFQKGVCRLCEKFCEAKAVNFDQKPLEMEIEVGTIIVATGYDPFDASKVREYGYGQYRNVITGLEFERITNAAGPTGGKIIRSSDSNEPKKVAFILCVGSREEREGGLSYCCRIGCVAALKHAYILKSKFGDEVDVFICYTDLRTFGKGHEEFYRTVRDMGVKFIHGKPSEIHELPDKSLVFDVFDTTTNLMLRVTADIVVLINGIEPSYGSDDLARLLKIPKGPEGFLMELHPKLKPIETAMDGIFIAGVAQGPKDITDTVAQAGAAAAAAGALMARGQAETPPILAVVDETTCSGCGKCVSVCGYGAIRIVEKEERGRKRKVAEVVEALCKGCGACGAACLSGCITMRHFTDAQIIAMINAFGLG